MSLPPFGFVCVHHRPLADGIGCEAGWMRGAAVGQRAVAHLWQGCPGWVVPRRYTSLPGWPAALARHAGEVQVRASGGGLVPQGPGVWNLSLAWPAPGATPTAAEAVYAELCRALAEAFARLGVAATPQPVPGSFCDGRFNLASRGRKFVGTAQAWKRVDGRPLLLVHAVVIVSADPAELTAQANAFEAALGRGAPYRADALTSLALEAPAAAGIEERTIAVLGEQFARVVPPRVHLETEHGPA